METDSKTLILESAARLTKLKGFDAFSYRDISAEIGIKTSSIHYHYPTKLDLAVALVDYYGGWFLSFLRQLSGKPIDGFEQLKTLFEAIANVSGEERHMCLCGMLCADVHSVSETAKDKLHQFFVEFEDWLTKTIQKGVEEGSIHTSIRPKSTAKEIAAITEGSMLIARVNPNKQYVSDTFSLILARLRP